MEVLRHLARRGVPVQCGDEDGARGGRHEPEDDPVDHRDDEADQEAGHPGEDGSQDDRDRPGRRNLVDLAVDHRVAALDPGRNDVRVAGIDDGQEIERLDADRRELQLLDQLADAFALKLPVMGDLIRKVSVAKFTRTLGTLMASGVPIMEGLLIVARTAGNKIVEEAVVMTRQSVSEGKTLAEPLSKSKVFPPMVTQMISVGEATGALDNMLGKIADFYDDEVDSAVATLTSLLEPMLMIFLGTTVGFVIVAMYMPIFQMGSTIK